MKGNLYCDKGRDSTTVTAFESTAKQAHKSQNGYFKTVFKKLLDHY